MNRVIHFEIHAENPDRAIAFYTDLFGWKFDRWGAQEYWIVYTGSKSDPGIDGGLVKRRGTIDGTAVLAYVCTIDVDALDASVARAVALGGGIALEKMPIPGMGWLAYCKDTEGNIFGMMQSDPSAK
ncbi:MAG TPA: VOC family protein [Bacteroidota bacterium]|nr:VOC family protein [Bacteroidota bacterium]